MPNRGTYTSPNSLPHSSANSHTNAGTDCESGARSDHCADSSTICRADVPTDAGTELEIVGANVAADRPAHCIPLLRAQPDAQYVADTCAKPRTFSHADAFPDSAASARGVHLGPDHQPDANRFAAAVLASIEIAND